jgi:hypothetical protein
MSGSPLVDTAEAAGTELAARLRIPCDILDVHRVNDSRGRIYSSLRYGAFLLAFAPLEGFFTQLTQYGRRKSWRALPLNLDKIQQELDSQWPDAHFRTHRWEGRTRQQPTRPGSRSEWAHLTGARLKAYLADMKMLRDLLSHGGNPVKVSNRGQTLWEVRDGWSLRLMGVEGFIQLAEDLAEQALLEADVPPGNVPVWPEPQRSGISMSGLPALPNRDRLAILRGHASQGKDG